MAACCTQARKINRAHLWSCPTLLSGAFLKRAHKLFRNWLWCWERCNEGEKQETLQLLPSALSPSSLLVAIYPSLNGVCLPDLPRMKCHILDWSLSLNRFLCLPWFLRPSLTWLLGLWPLMCQPQLGTLGVGYLWCVHASGGLVLLWANKSPRGYQDSVVKETTRDGCCCAALVLLQLNAKRWRVC